MGSLVGYGIAPFFPSFTFFPNIYPIFAVSKASTYIYLFRPGVVIIVTVLFGIKKKTVGPTQGREVRQDWVWPKH